MYYPNIMFQGKIITNIKVINKNHKWYEYHNYLNEESKTELLTDDDKKEFNIVVGKSKTNNKVVILPQKNLFVSHIPVNKQLGWKDKFKVSISGNELTVTRIDNDCGWGQNLIMKAITLDYLIEKLKTLK